ncbi:MAG: cytochrome c-type biogenesis protein CcmH [Lautropia sp.]|nr:cytochrome c-type biogenesis protein CcmH [Lautropia sp.]
MKTERFRRLAGELRCLVCQNQSLVDSNAPLAQDLRDEVVKLMASGRDDGQIKSFLVERYGEFVLYRPAVSMRNALLWFGPFLLLVIATIAWMRLGRRKPPAAQSAQDALKHVDELLGR